MRAITCTRYGPPDVLPLSQIDKPVMKENEVLIRVYATTVSSGDSRIRNGSRKSLPPYPHWIFLEKERLRTARKSSYMVRREV